MGAKPSKPTDEQCAELEAIKSDAIKRAAAAIRQSDALLLMTGAGWSADSGLAVYADVACMPAYLERGLTYRDLCDPGWLEKEPALFLGFWGTCFNDYRNTVPHEGYQIVARWRDRFFRHTSAVAGTPPARRRAPSFHSPPTSMRTRINTSRPLRFASATATLRPGSAPTSVALARYQWPRAARPTSTRRL